MFVEIPVGNSVGLDSSGTLHEVPRTPMLLGCSLMGVRAARRYAGAESSSQILVSRPKVPNGSEYLNIAESLTLHVV
eukprot:COSAG02_NODE_778_length_17288_cov_102.024725_9_plen_77_part_00